MQPPTPTPVRNRIAISSFMVRTSGVAHMDTPQISNMMTMVQRRPIQSPMAPAPVEPNSTPTSAADSAQANSAGSIPQSPETLGTVVAMATRS